MVINWSHIFIIDSNFRSKLKPYTILKVCYLSQMSRTNLWPINMLSDETQQHQFKNIYSNFWLLFSFPKLVSFCRKIVSSDGKILLLATTFKSHTFGSIFVATINQCDK